MDMGPSQHEDTIISDLVCAICNELFVEPLSFSCGHSFCRECIRRWASHKRCHQLRNTCVTFPCPLCKENLPLVVLESTNLNIALRNLVDDLKKKKESLDFCELHPREETKFVCMTCLVVFCGTCSAIERFHNNRDHDVSSKENVRQEIELMFREHKQNIDLAAKEVRSLFQSVQLALEELMEVEMAIFRKLTADTRLLQERINSKRKDYISFLDNDVRILKEKWDSFALKVTGKWEEEDNLAKEVVLLNWLRQSEPEIQRLNEERAKARQQWGVLKMERLCTPSIDKGMGQSELNLIIQQTVSSVERVRKIDSSNRTRKGKESLTPFSFLVAEYPKVEAQRMSNFSNASHHYLKDANLFNNSILVINHYQNTLQRINIFDGCSFTLNDDLERTSLRRHICGKMDTLKLYISVSIENTSESTTNCTTRTTADSTTTTSPGSTTNGITDNSTCKLAVLKLTWNPFLAFAGTLKTCHSFPGLRCKKLRRARNDVFVVSSQGELLQVHTCDITSPSKQWTKYHFTGVEDMVVFESDKTVTLFVKRGLRTITFCDYPGRECDWVQCDTCFLNEVSFMTADNEGNLWILDTTQENLLACMTRDGCLHIKKRIEVVGEVHSIFNCCNDLLLITKDGSDEGVFSTIPFSDVR